MQVTTNNTPILIDTNVFMYAVGAAHPLKVPAQRVLRLAAQSEELFTNAEVFQEMIWRYLSQRRWSLFQPRVEAFARLLAGRIEPIYAEDVTVAGSLAQGYPRLSARDLIHVAVMQRVGATHIVTADTAFDAVEGIERLDPARVDEWRSFVA